MNKLLYSVLIVSGFMIFFSYSCKSDKPETTQKENASTQTTKESTTAKEEIKNAADVKLSPEEQKKLNVFFSNFSEVNLGPFTSDNIKDEALIDFGVLHIYKNNRNEFEKADNASSKIKAEYVNDAVKQYFKKDVKEHKATRQFKFKNGWYYLPDADGEAFTFSQVERMTDLGKDTFSAYVNVYTASSGWIGNAHANPKEWKKDGDEAPTLSVKFKATIQKDTNKNGKITYTLIDYIKQ